MKHEKVAHISSGIRGFFKNPHMYNMFQSITGGNRERKRVFKKYMNPSQEEKVLDIGCGTGYLSGILSDDVEYVGYDMEESYIKYAQKKYINTGDFFNARVNEEMAKQWTSHFDIVNAHGLLHHLSDNESEELFKIARLCLKDGGYLFTADSTYHKDQSKIDRWIVSKDRGQNIRTPEQYVCLAKKYFERVDSELCIGKLFVPFSVFVMISYK